MTRKWLFGLSACLIGAVGGASFTYGATQNERMLLQADRKKWEQKALHWEREWNQLHQEVDSANLRATRQTYIQSIDVTVLKAPVDPKEVRTALEPYTAALLGMRLSGLKANVVYHMFDGRIVVIGAQLYRLSVRAVLLAPKSELLVDVTPVVRPRSS